jgi:hypothetical protein
VRQPDTPMPTEYPQGIGRVARRELVLHGYIRFDQLARMTTAWARRRCGSSGRSLPPGGSPSYRARFLCEIATSA